MRFLKERRKCHYCGEEIEVDIFSYKKICPYCGKDNGSVAIRVFEQEQKEKAQVEQKITKLKELFNSDEEVNLSFKKICEIGGSCLVYNFFTKIVYIKQAYTRGYDTFATEHYCPFISTNGRYYKYIESENKIVEV